MVLNPVLYNKASPTVSMVHVLATVSNFANFGTSLSPLVRGHGPLFEQHEPMSPEMPYTKFGFRGGNRIKKVIIRPRTNITDLLIIQ